MNQALKSCLSTFVRYFYLLFWLEEESRLTFQSDYLCLDTEQNLDPSTPLKDTKK